MLDPASPEAAPRIFDFSVMRVSSRFFQLKPLWVSICTSCKGSLGMLFLPICNARTQKVNLNERSLRLPFLGLEGFKNYIFRLGDPQLITSQPLAVLQDETSKACTGPQWLTTYWRPGPSVSWTFILQAGAGGLGAGSVRTPCLTLPACSFPLCTVVLRAGAQSSGVTGQHHRARAGEGGDPQTCRSDSRETIALLGSFTQV